ncbi:MAG: FtsX-like permease family protein [Candidatus Bathyarchaeota archaeon]|nr:MAG: FtsX-like permease family protein [Candidatus Bathyarchaeota archaeon]
MGVAVASTFVIAVGATTLRYTAVVKEMSVLFSGQIIVVSKDAIVIQAVPIGGGMLQQAKLEREIAEIQGIDEKIPILLLTSIETEGILQPIPVNFSLGIPVDKWRLILGPTPLRENIGRFPRNESSKEAVIGASLADQYNWTVGKEIIINEQRLTVTGILDSKLALLNRCIIMSLTQTQALSNYQGSVNIVAIKPLEGYADEVLAKNIEQNITYVKALTEDERNDIIQPVLSQVETWNLGIHTVILMLSLILVMTVTTMNVSERRRDFATLDAIGAPLSFVFRAVLLETLLIGVIGGAIGIILGSIAALVLASLYTNISLVQFFPSIFQVAPPTYLLGIFFSIAAVCCLGGIIPAINATRMRIAETLRAEY